RRHIAALFESSGGSEAALALAPSETIGRGFEHGAKTIVLQIAKAKFQRLDAGQRRHLLPMAFAREAIGGAGESTIGAGAQRGVDGMELDLLVRDVVQRVDRRRSGVVIVKLPGSEAAGF